MNSIENILIKIIYSEREGAKTMGRIRITHMNRLKRLRQRGGLSMTRNVVDEYWFMFEKIAASFKVASV